jgi:hypothetical protein
VSRRTGLRGSKRGARARRGGFAGDSFRGSGSSDPPGHSNSNFAALSKSSVKEGLSTLRICARNPKLIPHLHYSFAREGLRHRFDGSPHGDLCLAQLQERRDRCGRKYHHRPSDCSGRCSRLQVVVGSGPGLILLSASLSDFCVYWGHRLQPRRPLLWRFHSIHHSTEHLDWLAAHREHPLDTAYTMTLINLPGFLLGVPLGMLAGLVTFRGIWAIYIHSNIRLPIGPLRGFIGAPEPHHWHHDKSPRRWQLPGTDIATLQVAPGILGERRRLLMVVRRTTER